MSAFAPLSCLALALTTAAGGPNVSGPQTLDLSGYVSLPLRIEQKGMAWVDARVAGKTIHFLVDSGCNLSVLHNASAASLGLKIRDAGRDTKGPMVAPQRAKRAKLDDFSFGSLRLKSVEMDVVDIGTPLYGLVADRSELYGILGNDILRRYDGLIDYRGRRLYLRDAEKQEAAAWEGRWELEKMRYQGTDVKDAKYLAGFKLLVANDELRLSQPGSLQVGKLHVLNSTRPKIWAMSALRQDGKFLNPDRQPPKPGEYDVFGCYESDGDWLRFTMPTVAQGGTYTGPPKLESTSENKQILFTWKRVKPAAK